MLICVSEVIVVRQLSSSFSRGRRGRLGNYRFVTRLLCGYFGRYDSNQESDWKWKIFHRKREKLFHKYVECVSGARKPDVRIVCDELVRLCVGIATSNVRRL